VPSRSEEDSVALLLAKKVDYVLMDELVVQYILEKHPNEARTKLSVGTTPLLKRALHLAVRRAHPDAGSIVERFNAQLRGMIADRTYHRLLNVSWILADVDGDGVAELVPRNELRAATRLEMVGVKLLQVPQKVWPAIFTVRDAPTATGDWKDGSLET
jgi:hypothetical protein